MKITYYSRIILFIIYLLCMFLLIDKILTISILGTVFFIFEIIYSILMILTILSKKDIFIKDAIFNLFNITLYLYTYIIFYMAYVLSSKLDIISNKMYYQNNFVLIIFTTTIIIFYTIYLNKKNDKNI